MYKLDLEEELGNSKIHWIIEKTRELQKNIYFCIIDYAKDFGCVDHNKLWKILNVVRRFLLEVSVQFSRSVVSDSATP